jgi:UDP-N-acetylmuramate--alanine ligase
MAIPNVPQHVHIIGAGGAAMSGIAQILHAQGHTVTGSDWRQSASTDKLERLGMHIEIGHSAENIGDAELVVTTSAAQATNAEIVEAERRGIPVIKRAEMIGRIMAGHYGIAIAGTHGKTTTSGLVAHMLHEAGMDPAYLVGGDVRTLGSNAGPGGGEYIVVEADEFDRAFLSYHPDIAVILNIEPDHLNIYEDEGSVESAFAQFLQRVPEDGHVITCADSPRLVDAIDTTSISAQDRQTYSIERSATWRASNIRAEGETQAFEVDRQGAAFGAFTISLAGLHNVSNALAGIAVGDALGLDASIIRDALASYRGTGRRFELVGEAAAITVMDDYAHHPTEVHAIVLAARQRFPGRRLVVLFQPHTYSRNKYLFDEWTRCFTGIDHLYFAETDGDRETLDDGVSSAAIVAAMTPPPATTYCDSLDVAIERVADEAIEGDVVFTIGAGEVKRAGKAVLKLLQERSG